MPYKKPKDSEDGGKGKVKMAKGKLAKLHSAKLIKNAKSGGNKVTAAKAKVTSVEKNFVKLPSKEEKKRKDSAKDEKVLSASKKLGSLAVQIKKTPVPKGTMGKDVKAVLSAKLLQAVPKGIHPPIKEEPKSDAGKSTSPKNTNVVSKTSSTSPKGSSQAQKNDTSVTEKSKSDSTVEKEVGMVTTQKSVKVDSGTQSMKSMIGVNKVKTKPTASSSLNESVKKDDKGGLSNLNENVAKEESTEVDVVDVNEKQGNVEEKTVVESKVIAEVSASEKESKSSNDVEASANKNDEDMNENTTDADSSEKDKTNDKLEEKKLDTKEQEDIILESNNTEGSKEGVKQDKEDTTDSKNLADSIMTRGRRSASRSPVITREIKSTDVSPRRCRSLNTPERKREDKQIVPTIMTRKRLASFSESEADKKVDDSPAGKKRALAAALLERMSRKAADSSNAAVATNKVKMEHPYAKEEKEPEKEGESSIFPIYVFPFLLI